MSGTAGTDDEISYLALQNGTPVLSSSATEFGTVHHVLVVESLDLFDGIVVKVHHGLCFVDRDQIAKITRTAVHCQLSDAEVAALPPPSNPPVEVAESVPGRGHFLARPLWSHVRPRALGRAQRVGRICSPITQCRLSTGGHEGRSRTKRAPPV